MWWMVRNEICWKPVFCNGLLPTKKLTAVNTSKDKYTVSHLPLIWGFLCLFSFSVLFSSDFQFCKFCHSIFFLYVYIIHTTSVMAISLLVDLVVTPALCSCLWRHQCVWICACDVGFQARVIFRLLHNLPAKHFFFFFFPFESTWCADDVYAPGSPPGVQETLSKHTV